jgi:peptide-methionine (R)-S-oxide reductase
MLQETNRRRIMTTRRSFLINSAVFAGLAAITPTRTMAGFEIQLTPAEWKARLTPAQYAVLRDEDTERPFSNSLKGESSPLLKEARNGTYHCAACDLAAYPSSTKFDSGTGWPSFWDALPGGIGTKSDNTLFTTRTEVHCSRCGGHFGHIFEDGPKPTGKRHCLNGLALTFKAA